MTSVLRRTTPQLRHRLLVDPLELLPHRYPFLLVDSLEVVEPGRRATGRKLVTGAEWALVGTRATDGKSPTWRGSLAMPHALLVEALAQLSAGVIAGLIPDATRVIGYFMGCESIRLRGEARPGDTVELAVELLHFRRGICRMRATAHVGSRSLVRAVMTTVLRPIDAVGA